MLSSRIVRHILAPVLQIQIINAIGYAISIFVGLWYIVMGDPRFGTHGTVVAENLMPVAVGLVVSLACFGLGWFLSNKKSGEPITIPEGAWIVFWVWFVACSISSLVFNLGGFPDPATAHNYDWFSRYINGFFEAMSGFTTSGTSILNNVELYSRSLLFRRSAQHWIGGMGIAFMAVTVWKYFTVDRSEVITAEAESPHRIIFDNQAVAIQSGKDFLKIYIWLSVICVVLLVLAGLFTRVVPYQFRRDNIYDAIVHMFAAMGTGGFSTYGLSVGLPDANGVIGGLMNPVSEVILATFMMIAGSNLALWYILFFEKDRRDAIKKFFSNHELHRYVAVIATLVAICTAGLYFNIGVKTAFNYDFLTSLRHAYFNITNIISTTGFGTSDFALWPALAMGGLFVAYLVGAMVGGTGGGLKMIRFAVMYKYCKAELKNMIEGTNITQIEIDGEIYDNKKIGLILLNIVIYYLLFLFGGILILMVNPILVGLDGTQYDNTLWNSLVSSIANLGNIGPAVTYQGYNVGPTGNFFAFNNAAKIIMIILMYVGRVGVLSLLALFMNKSGAKQLETIVATKHYDHEHPSFRG